MLTIYNTLNKQKEVFKPMRNDTVGIYVCGMTVYDYCHIGHARVLVAFDVIVRHLRHRFKTVTYVRNITDIDDKIIRRSIENKEDIHTLTARFIDAMHQDERALGVLSPDEEPKATDYIEQMLELINALSAQGLAYQASNGDVYFSVRNFEHYGKLSGRNLDNLRAGARVDVEDDKQDPLDFVLWKKAKADEPSWPSKWGRGRPGWHIECSAMSTHHLGIQFDLHGGGSDLVFPHHENEIAQSEGANNCAFVNYWLHVGFINVDNEKMSKSLGNFSTIRDILKQYSGEVLRYFLIATHYRSPINFSDDNLNNAHAALVRLYTAIRGLSTSTAAMDEITQNFDFEHRFMAALDDDFNTPVALAVLFELAKEINIERTQDMDRANALAQHLIQLANHIGLLENDANTFLTQGSDLADEAIEEKIHARNQARHNKDFARSDSIRDELAKHGIILEDSKGEDNQDKTTWRRA